MAIYIMNILAETKKYFLYHEYEYPYLKDKQTSEIIALPNHYGDPVAGIIDVNENWCVVAGHGIYLYLIKDDKIHKFIPDLWINSIKLLENENIKILIDPWSREHGVWNLDVKKLKVDKINNGYDFQELPYCENIDF